MLSVCIAILVRYDKDDERTTNHPILFSFTWNCIIFHTHSSSNVMFIILIIFLSKYLFCVCFVSLLVLLLCLHTEDDRFLRKLYSGHRHIFSLLFTTKTVPFPSYAYMYVEIVTNPNNKMIYKSTICHYYKILMLYVPFVPGNMFKC